MSLTAGRRLGPYEVVAPLGAGGMGEVYRATDTRLGRSVAIKILSSDAMGDEELRGRFEREARAISALNHPNICTLYDVGQHDGIEYLVMELLQGQTLADRIRRGALPVDDVIRIGREIADALERAHRAGIVHRDLKPSNIILTPNGAKLLDFGIAKYTAAHALTSSEAETATALRPLTGDGTLVGTFFYMSPEQLEGRKVDHRADLFALGVVLYEMVTGERAFDGTSRAGVIASVLTKEPPRVSERRQSAAGVLDDVIDACLRKNPDERIQSAFDIKLALQWALRQRSARSVEPPFVRRAAAGGVIALAIIGAALAGYFASRHAGPAEAAPIRAALPLPSHESLGAMTELAISPDGTTVVFRLAEEKSPLWLRRLSDADARPIPETEGAVFPFWSPDSRSIGFFADRKLKTVAIEGGTPFVVCDAPAGRGGTWSGQGTIVFAPSGNSPLFSVASRGGVVTPLTKLRTTPRDSSHRYPQFLPDGTHFLFFVMSEETTANQSYAVYAGSLGSRETQRVLEVPSNASYSSGRLFYELQGSLVSIPFDARSLRANSDEPKVIAEGVQYFRPFAWGDFSVSDNGVLAYVVAKPSRAVVTRFDMAGRNLGSVGTPEYQRYGSLSPQGDRMAVVRFDPHTQDGDIWIVGTKQNELVRLTNETALYMRPVWSPDEQHILFGTEKHAFENLYVVPASGGTPQLLIGGDGYKIPSDWSSTGYIAFTRAAPKTSWDIWIAPLDHPEKAFPFVAAPAQDVDARFSPDATAIAYSSNETGVFEVYVRTFPGAGEAIRVSTNTGSSPRWSRDGKALYYLRGTDSEVIRVPVTSTHPWQFGEPQPLFPAPIPNSTVDSSDYDISADGREFILTLPEEPVARQIFIDTVWRTAAR